MQPEDKALLEANVRRVVGVATLRRLRRLVDESQEDERRQAAFAKYALAAIGGSIVLLVLFCWLSPQSAIAALRSMAGLIR